MKEAAAGGRSLEDAQQEFHKLQQQTDRLNEDIGQLRAKQTKWEGTLRKWARVCLLANCCDQTNGTNFVSASASSGKRDTSTPN